MRTMKDSGIPWMGKIPSNWRIGKVKHFYRFITGFTPDSKNESFYDENGTPWVTISDMDGKYVVGTKNGISSNYVSAKNPTLVPSNSLLYSFKLSVGQVARTTFDVYTNEAIASFLPLDNISLDYLFYSSQVCIIENANENIYGAKLLNQDLINSATILFPPLEEQQRIAEFLDRKCAEVDEMIALQEQIIEELKAYKQSVITEAVTKGLNPDVPMKDSGIEWIGNIPEHWEVRKLSRLLSFKGGFAFNSDDFKESGNNQVVRIGNIRNDFLRLDVSPVYISTNIASQASKAQLEKGQILFTMTGTKGKRDYFYTLLLKDEDFDGRELYLNQRVGCFVKKDGVCAAYYNYLLKDNNILDSIFIYETGTANQGNLGIETIKRTMLQYPPLNEQQKISEYLNAKCTEIDNLISIKLSKIDSLKEYKKSIIYEYVTGKREVNE